MKDPTYKEVTNAEFVKMTRKEHIKLIERFGEVNTSKAIEKLDNYKGAHGKKYKSDYRAICLWVMPSLKESSNGSGYPTYYDQKFEKTLSGDSVLNYHRYLIGLGWKKNYSGTAGTTWRK